MTIKCIIPVHSSAYNRTVHKELLNLTYLPYLCCRKVAKQIAPAIVCTNIEENRAHRNI